MNINTIEQLLEFVINDDGSVALNDIRLTGSVFNYKFHFIGERWKGKVDVKIADIVKSMQEQFSYMYSLSHNVTIGEARKNVNAQFPVEFSIQDGSTYNEIAKQKFEELLSALLEGFRTMEPTEKNKLYKLLAILAFAGLIIYFPIQNIANNFIDSNKRVELQRLSYEHEQNNTEGISLIIDKLQKPNQVIAKVLENEDTLVIENTGESVNKNEAVNRFKIVKDTNIEIFHADDAYIVTDINSTRESEELFGQIISDEGIEVSVQFDLTDDERDLLWRSLKTKTPEPLMLNIDFKNKKPSKGRVVGLGAPRQDAKTLRQIIDSYKGR